MLLKPPVYTSSQSRLPKWARRPYLQMGLLVALLYFVLTYFYTRLRTLDSAGGSRGVHTGLGRSHSISDTTSNGLLLSPNDELTMMMWKYLVAEAPKPIVGEDTWLYQQARLLNHFRELRRIRKRIPGTAPSKMVAAMDADLRRMEHASFPFINFRNNHTFDTLLEMPKRGRAGRGIVIAAGEHHFRFLLHFLASLRNTIKSDIPVEVFYRGSKDLNDTQQHILRTEFRNVLARDILAENLWSEDEVSLRDATYALKVFALLSSSFSEPILCDADIVIFQDPYKLYDDPDYQETGTLFYHDRLFSGLGLRAWMKEQYSLVPELTPSPVLISSVFWNTEMDSNEQDSGLVLINRGREDVMLSFMLTAWLNSQKQRDLMTAWMYGDKETFWLAFELTKQPYAWGPKRACAAGKYLSDGNRMMVDNMLHFDRDMKPLWLNGGLLLSKHMENSPWLLVDTVGLGDGSWLFDRPLWTYGNATWRKEPELGALMLDMARAAQKMEDKYHPSVHIDP